MKKLLLSLFAVLGVASSSIAGSTPTLPQLLNVSTRSFVQSGDNVMIGGFIIVGPGAKTVVVRAIGPSLTAFGVPNVLADPTLELHEQNSLLAMNDNWQTTQIFGLITADQVSALQNSGLAPTNAAESAIIVSLQPGNYTAIVRGNNGIGNGLVEVYDLGPTVTQHLYVGNDNPADGVRQYDLPLSGTSTPNFTVPVAGSTVAVGVDANGDLVAGLIGPPLGRIMFYPAPLSAGSTPSATFNNGASGNTGDVKFSNANNLFATGFDGGGVRLFTHPFSNASTPSQTITNAGLTAADGLALDGAQNLYVGNSPISASSIFVFAPPYSGAPIIMPAASNTSYRKMAVGAAQLFVTVIEPNPALGRLDVFNLPITATSTPAFTIRTGMNIPEAVTLDAAGNLYVGNLGNATVTVYMPPFSSNSVPSTTLFVSSGSYAIFGIAIGK